MRTTTRKKDDTEEPEKVYKGECIQVFEQPAAHASVARDPPMPSFPGTKDVQTIGHSDERRSDHRSLSIVRTKHLAPELWDKERGGLYIGAS